MRPAVIPPVSVGRPAAAAGHGTAPGFVGFSVWLIGYVSFELELSPSIGAGELPVVALRAEILAWGRVLATGYSKRHDTQARKDRRVLQLGKPGAVTRYCKLTFVVAGLCLSA